MKSVDDAIAPADSEQVFECHPELAFTHLADEVNQPRPTAGKKTPEGVAERRRILKAWRPDIVTAADRQPHPTDDVYDSIASVWVATRWLHGDAMSLTDGRVDGRGLPMRIIY